MADVGTNGGSNDHDTKIRSRILLVSQLKDAGFTSALSISEELIRLGYTDLDVSERSIYRDLARLREERRDRLQDIINGEFIIEFDDALNEFKRIIKRALDNQQEARVLHAKREVEINTLMQPGVPKMAYLNANLQAQKLQNDSQLYGVLQTNDRLVKDTRKEYLTVYGKTEMIWALDEWIRKNSPKPLDKKVMKALELPEPEKHEDGE